MRLDCFAVIVVDDLAINLDVAATCCGVLDFVAAVGIVRESHGVRTVVCVDSDVLDAFAFHGITSCPPVSGCGLSSMT